METHHYWEENGHTVKYDNYNSNDGFGRPGEVHYAPPSEDEAEYPQGAYLKKGKVSRQDPMSHRIIEKRRRDRMNNCLADLSRLIPPEYLKKGRGRVEKTEIIEMAIRHIKFLQDRVNAAEYKAPEPYRVGYQEAVGEAVRFLVEVQGLGPADGLCVQMAAHLQRHCEIVTKANGSVPREKIRSHIGGSSSETASSSSSSHGYIMKGVIQRPEPPPFPEPYEPERPADNMYQMECDRMPVPLLPVDMPANEPLPLDRHKRDLRKVRKPDHDDYLHSYKFKNSIERRFSRSQDSEAAENGTRGPRAFTKRRRANKPMPPSTSASTSGSTEDARDTSPQDTSSESPHHHQYEKLSAAQQLVPVFALNAIGKYYVPLCVERACLSRGDAWEGTGAAPLHPVTIHVNFTPCGACVKREPDWRPG